MYVYMCRYIIISPRCALDWSSKSRDLCVRMMDMDKRLQKGTPIYCRYHLEVSDAEVYDVCMMERQQFGSTRPARCNTADWTPRRTSTMLSTRILRTSSLLSCIANGPHTTYLHTYIQYNDAKYFVAICLHPIAFVFDIYTVYTYSIN